MCIAITPLTGSEPIGIVDSAFFDFQMEGRHVLVVERHLSADQDEEDNAEAPHVHLGTCVWLRLQQFRGRKIQTPAVRLESPILLGGKEVAEAEVDDLDVASLADQDVLYLQVPMHNAVAMAVVDGACYLPGKLAGLLLLELAVRDDIIQHLATIDIFKEHIPVPSCAQVVPQPTDVLVIEEAHDRRFSRIAVFSGRVRLLSFFPALATIVGGHPLDNLTGDLWRG